MLVRQERRTVFPLSTRDGIPPPQARAGLRDGARPPGEGPRPQPRYTRVRDRPGSVVVSGSNCAVPDGSRQDVELSKGKGRMILRVRVEGQEHSVDLLFSDKQAIVFAAAGGRGSTVGTSHTPNDGRRGDSGYPVGCGRLSGLRSRHRQRGLCLGLSGSLVEDLKLVVVEPLLIAPGVLPAVRIIPEVP